MLPPVTANLLDELKTQTLALMEKYQVPGVAVGFSTPQGRHYLGCGTTSIDNPLPITEDTLFLIGSIGKTYTASLIMRLIEEQKLTLDTPVKQLVPELQLGNDQTTERLTVRHLLTHSGGWWDGTDEATGDGDNALERFIQRLVEMPQIMPVGQHFSYSNSGFNLLGRIIEKVTGLTYEGAVTQLVLEPLGLSDTHFFARDVMTRRFAVGHTMQGESLQIVRPWTLPRSGNASGGISASMHDLLTYAEVHLGQGQLLQAGTRHLMQQPHIPVDDGAHGLPWAIWQRGGVTFVSHDGAMPGQHASLWLVPTLGVACAVLTNADVGAQLHHELSEWVRKHWLEVPAAPKHTFKETVALTEYVGCYPRPGSPETFFLRTLGGKLELLLSTEPNSTAVTSLATLEFFAPDRARSLGSPSVEHTFLRNRQGVVQGMRFFSRVLPRERAEVPDALQE